MQGALRLSGLRSALAATTLRAEGPELGAARRQGLSARVCHGGRPVTSSRSVTAKHTGREDEVCAALSSSRSNYSIKNEVPAAPEALASHWMAKWSVGILSYHRFWG